MPAAKASGSATRASIFACIVAALLGALYARWLYGWRVIDPSSVQWLLHGDPAQHFVGLSFFLAEPWHWPPGAIFRFGVEPTSVVYTDSIPLLALFAKAAGVPSGTQFFGAWMLACHVLLAAFGTLLLRRLGAPAVAAVVGAMFFASAPVVLIRAYGHEALMGQFLIVAALAAAFGRWSAVTWTVLLAVSVLVHPYLAAMVLTVAAAATAAALQRHALRPAALLRRAPALFGVPALAAWLAGYFVGSGEHSAAGFDFFSANALTWFDPFNWNAFLRDFGRETARTGEWSALLPALRRATIGQYEGFAYLGAGAILLVVVASWLAARERLAARGHGAVRPAPNASGARWGWVLAACVALALLSLSTRPSIGSYVLLEVPLAESAQYLLGVFRASGRFVWPLTWLLLAWAIARVARMPRAALLLAAVLLVQAVDLAPKHRELRDRFRHGPPGIQAEPRAPVWASALRACPRLQWLGDVAQSERWITPALAAVRADARLVDAPTARRSAAAAFAQARALEALARGDGWRADTVYVDLRPDVAAAAARAPDRPLGAPAALRPVRADGFVLLAAPRCLPRPAD